MRCRPGSIDDVDLARRARAAASSPRPRRGQRAQVDRLAAASRARVTRESCSRSSISWPMRCAAAADALEVARCPSSSSCVAVVLEQRLAEAVDAAQRRAQVVRDRVAERLQLLVGRFELGGALAHALLELRVEPPDFLLGLLELLSRPRLPAGSWEHGRPRRGSGGR